MVDGRLVSALGGTRGGDRGGAAEPGGGLVEGGAGRNRQLERIAALGRLGGVERLLGETCAAAGEAALSCLNS